MDKLLIEGGVRLSAFIALKDASAYFGIPDIRLAAKYSPAENLSFKAGLNTLTQYIHLISNTSAVSPMDTWKLSDADIKPTWGWQGAGGVYWTELNTGIGSHREPFQVATSSKPSLVFREGNQVVGHHHREVDRGLERGAKADIGPPEEGSRDDDAGWGYQATDADADGRDVRDALS